MKEVEEYAGTFGTVAIKALNIMAGKVCLGDQTIDPVLHAMLKQIMENAGRMIVMTAIADSYANGVITELDARTLKINL